MITAVTYVNPDLIRITISVRVRIDSDFLNPGNWIITVAEGNPSAADVECTKVLVPTDPNIVATDTVFLQTTQHSADSIYEIRFLHLAATNGFPLFVSQPRVFPYRSRKTKVDQILNSLPNHFDKRVESNIRSLLTAISLQDELIGGARNDSFLSRALNPGGPEELTPPYFTFTTPFIYGSDVVGSTLTCDSGTYDGTDPITVSYQWKRNSVDIGGATSDTYVTTLADASAVLTCTVTLSNVVGSTSSTAPGLTVESLYDVALALAYGIGPKVHFDSVGLPLGPLSTWTDLSGSGNHATSTGSSRPVATGTEVHFAGAQFMETSSFTMGARSSGVAVVRVHAVNHGVFQFSTLNTHTSLLTQDLGAGVKLKIRSTPVGDAGVPAAPFPRDAVCAWAFDTTGGTVIIDGTVIAMPANVMAGATATLRLGDLTGGIFPLLGAIKELLMLDTKLSFTDLQTLNDGFTDRWNSLNFVAEPQAIFGENLVAWYRADTGVTTSLGAVTSWQDQSCRYRDLTPGSPGTGSLTLDSAYVGGRDAVHTTGTHCMTTALSGISWTGGATIVTVGKQNAGGAATGGVTLGLVAGAAVDYVDTRTWLTGSNATLTSSDFHQATAIGTSEANPSTSARISTLVGTAGTLRTSNNISLTATYGASAALAPDTLAIFARVVGGPPGGTIGQDMAYSDIIVLSTVPTGPQYTQLVDYLQTIFPGTYP